MILNYIDDHVSELIKSLPTDPPMKRRELRRQRKEHQNIRDELSSMTEMLQDDLQVMRISYSVACYQQIVGLIKTGGDSASLLLRSLQERKESAEQRKKSLEEALQNIGTAENYVLEREGMIVEQYNASKREQWERRLDWIKNRIKEVPSGKEIADKLIYIGLAGAIATTLVATEHYKLEERRSIEQLLTQPAAIRQEISQEADAEENVQQIPQRLEEHLQGVELTYGKPLFVVDPEEHRTIVYKIELVEEMDIPTYTGMKKGPKEKSGDSKTPENIKGEVFKVISVHDYSDAISPFDPDVRPYNGDFGRLDTLDKKLGKMNNGRSSIGLHGVGDRHIEREANGAAAEYLQTHGCVAFENKDHDEMMERGYLSKGTSALISSGILEAAR